MKSKVPILVSFLLLITVVFSFAAKPVDVLLKPTEYGKPSKIVPLKNNDIEVPDAMPVHGMQKFGSGPGSSPFSVDMVLSYDLGGSNTQLVGLDQGFHLGVWFESPSACTLLAIYYNLAAGGAVTYYVSDPADTIDFLNDYEEYHGGVNPGPSPIESYLHPETPATAPDGWDTLIVSSMPDVGKNVFFAAYIMDDTSSHPLIDASISPPYHTLMQRDVGNGPFGWYSSWHHIYVRALVRMYENPPPAIASYDDLPNTYSTNGREVTANLTDLGIPLDSTGVVDADLIYSIDGGAYDTLDMTLISGDKADGTWKAILPGINAGHTMEYYIECYDMQGLQNLPVMIPESYTVKSKTSDILFVNDDYYGAPYSYDIISDVIPHADWWDIPSNGAPDNSVINAGYNVIIWNSWEYSGATFANAQSMIEDYLDGGGNLLVSGMDIPAGEFGYDWGDYTTSSGDFLRDYFGIRGGTDDYASDSISVYFGRTDDEICGIFNEDWPLTVYPYYFVGPGYNYNGRFDEDPDTTQWKGLLYDEWGNCSAFRFEQPGVYRVIWFYFPFAYIEDYLNPGTPEIEQQGFLMERSLDWLNPGPMLRDLTDYYTTANAGPYPVDVTLVNFDERPLASVNLIVSANGVMDTIAMAATDIDTSVYSADIPAYSVTTDIVFYAEATDTFGYTWASPTNEFWYYEVTGAVLYVNESYDPVLDYQDVLDSLSITGGYDVYDPFVYGVPDASVLASYNSVVWNADWGYGSILTKSSDGNVLYDYMVGGGNIFFTSDEILGLWDGWVDVDYNPGEFPYDVLKVTHVYNDICYDSVYGVAGDPITDGIIAEMTFPLTNWNDEVDIDAGATSIFTDAGATTVRGLRWDDTDNKVVFLPFMYVSLPKSDQISVLGNTLTWFGTKMKFSDGDGEVAGIPRVFALSQNKPNPCKDRASITYAIPKKTHVTLRLYNAAGQLIRTLVNEVEKPGYKTVTWDGLNKNNRRVSQGVYFYRITAGDFRSSRKLLVVR